MSSGVVESFDPQRGFGWIKDDADPEGRSLFVHFHDIEMDGFKVVYANDAVVVERMRQNRPRRKQVPRDTPPGAKRAEVGPKPKGPTRKTKPHLNSRAQCKALSTPGQPGAFSPSPEAFGAVRCTPSPPCALSTGSALTAQSGSAICLVPYSADTA